MKGIVLAGGTGSRLQPLTRATNKHLLPCGKLPMVYHPIQKLCEAGVRNILIITGTEHMGAMVQCLGSGEQFDAEFTYKVQENPDGIAGALRLAKDYKIDDSQMCVILGDNIFADPLEKFINHYNSDPCPNMAHIVLKRVADPARYGVATVSNGTIHGIIEKPSKDLLSDMMQQHKVMAVTGIYVYDHTVFDIIETLEPSARGELEITDVNMAYLRSGKLGYSVMQGWWSDAGSHQSLQHVNYLLQDEN
jgi:glucose-1-phosphate thymidylyltransferase